MQIVIIHFLQRCLVVALTVASPTTYSVSLSQFVSDYRNPQTGLSVWAHCPKSNVSLFLRRIDVDSWLTHFTMLSSVIIRKKRE